MTPDTYKVICMAVEDGVAIGVRRAYKHTDKPTEDSMIESIRQEVMNQVCEWFRFHEDKD
jgi:hypothetical protein